MKLLEPLLNLIAPHDCVGCGQEGSVLCDKCSLGAIEPVSSRCYRCKKVTDDFAVCSDCRKSSKLVNVWVCTEYGGLPKKLIYALKFQSVRSAAQSIAKQMADQLPYLPDEVVVTHVTTATSRRRQRGFDHAKAIASKLSGILGLEHKTLLVRTSQTRQVGSARQDRLKQLKGAFFAKSDLEGRTVLLVDDIVTTGGTLEAAAAELKRVGAKRVYAITFAQK